MRAIAALQSSSRSPSSVSSGSVIAPPRASAKPRPGTGAQCSATQLAGPKGNSPEDAVEDLLTAVAKGDALGVAEALAPGERDVLIDSMVPMIEELRRLEVFDPSLDLNRVAGVNGSLVGFKATSTKLRDDLYAVRITDGTLTTRFDPAKLPLGHVQHEIQIRVLLGIWPADLLLLELCQHLRGNDVGRQIVRIPRVMRARVIRSVY